MITSCMPPQWETRQHSNDNHSILFVVIVCAILRETIIIQLWLWPWRTLLPVAWNVRDSEIWAYGYTPLLNGSLWECLLKTQKCKCRCRIIISDRFWRHPVDLCFITPFSYSKNDFFFFFFGPFFQKQKQMNPHIPTVCLQRRLSGEDNSTTPRGDHLLFKSHIQMYSAWRGVTRFSCSRQTPLAMIHEFQHATVCYNPSCQQQRARPRFSFQTAQHLAKQHLASRCVNGPNPNWEATIFSGLERKATAWGEHLG